MSKNTLVLIVAIASSLGSWLVQLPVGPHVITPQSLGALVLLVVGGVSGIVGYTPGGKGAVVVDPTPKA
jgi:hypothetical protein